MAGLANAAAEDRAGIRHEEAGIERLGGVAGGAQRIDARKDLRRTAAVRHGEGKLAVRAHLSGLQLQPLGNVLVVAERADGLADRAVVVELIVEQAALDS